MTELTALELKCLDIVSCKDEETLRENANKPAETVATQRDYLAWEVSKSITRKTLPKDILEARDTGYIHWHDADFTALPQINCCLVNLKDMFDNGTVLNGKMIDEPKSFRTACTLLSQIAMTLTGWQYWGQTYDVSHLSKYLFVSESKIRRRLHNSWIELSEGDIEKLVEMELKRELSDSVQCIQYQMITMKGTGWQSPFCTLWMELRADDEYLKYTAMIIREILQQRIKGLKNAEGNIVTVAFPKLVYVLDENNLYPESEYYDITLLSAECTAKRIMPDYVSAKIQRKYHEGNTVPNMWCRNMLWEWKDENWEYKYYGRFNWGVVSLNLPRIALDCGGDEERFRDLFDERLGILEKALVHKHSLMKWIKASTSPLHWMYWAIARLSADDVIDEYLYWGYSSMGAGYFGMYETVYHILWESSTTEAGANLSLRIMNYFNDRCDKMTAKHNFTFGCYGTPIEKLCETACEKDKAVYWIVENVTDKGYYTNSFHIDTREEIDAFSKLAYESQFQPLSKAGCISYIETADMSKNIEAVMSVLNFIYDNIIYAWLNKQCSVCNECWFDGDLELKSNRWRCPSCGNTNRSKMSITTRICWYLSETTFNKGKENELENRMRNLHL